MEVLLGQEKQLEDQIDTYKTQLLAVEAALREGGGEDVKQIRDDLSQLVTLTEESLVELKKQRLLLMLHPPEQEAELETDGGKAEVGVATSSRACGTDTDDEVVGMKCRAPLTESWGAVNYHNAMVLGVESQATDDSENKVKVRVLFTQPLYSRMKPCPYFLEGGCKFTEETCKFSHGVVVGISELRSYEEHDFSLAQLGGKCLAKHTDDLWHPAIIRSLGNKCVVYFTDLNLQSEVDLDCVFPLESVSDSDSVSGDSDASDLEEEEEEVVRVVGWEPRPSHRPLGEWEKHTTGFGSKLLAKMGYVPGEGLGKSCQGRLEPVEIVVLPPGKSLDVCAEMREKKKLRRVDSERQRRRRKKKEKAAEMRASEEEQKMDMFDFLNTRIFRKMNSSQHNASSSTQKTSNSRSSGTKDNLNIRLFKVQEEIKSVHKRRQSLTQTLKRHQGRGGDKQMESHVREKMNEVERHLMKLQREEEMIEKSITSKTERRKLSVF